MADFDSSWPIPGCKKTFEILTFWHFELVLREHLPQ
jgi:hypothetical protein